MNAVGDDSPIDIWRGANVMVTQYGENTGLKVAVRFVTILAIFFLTIVPAHAETSAEYAKLGRKMGPAFECSVAAEEMKDREAQSRLFMLGYESGKIFLEAIAAGKVDRKDINKSVAVSTLLRMQGPNADFILGRIFEGVGLAYADNREDSCPSCLWNDDLNHSFASRKFREMNCDLLN